jgi:hypothetical protein
MNPLSWFADNGMALLGLIVLVGAAWLAGFYMGVRQSLQDEQQRMDRVRRLRRDES